MDSQKQQIAERLKQANNVLVTVSANPSVDQLAACIGLTIAINKLGKHATAVFSGAVPSTIEFLQPDKTLEKNTDSLRDFIIALDKSKADKLRYKVEDKVVKIFITPYRTSISEKDLEFSQGDFNVDVIVALGVHQQTDLDQAITAHGRILHDATITTINTQAGGELGGINWLDPKASSLSELATQLVDELDKKLVDNQVATAFLTGIVAETDRFSNEKTSPLTMSISSKLMSAGANQQLVAIKLEAPSPPPAATPPSTSEPQTTAPAPSSEPKEEKKKPDDGTLEISHEEKPAPPPPVAATETAEVPAQIHIDEHGTLQSANNPALAAATPPSPLPAQPPPPPVPPRPEPPHLVLQPPTFDSQLSANTVASGVQPAGPSAPSEASLSLPQVESPMPILDRQPLVPPAPSPSAAPNASTQGPPVQTGQTLPPIQPAGGVVPPPKPQNTLSDIERAVGSNHLNPGQGASALPPFPPLAGPDSPYAIPGPAPVITPVNNAVDNPTLPPISGSPTPPPGQPGTGSQNNDVPDLNSARAAVSEAISEAPPSQQFEPIQALNARPLGAPLHNGDTAAAGPAASSSNGAAVASPTTGTPPAPQPLNEPTVFVPQTNQQNDAGSQNNGMAPPPVPPPMLPPTQP